MNMNAPLSDFLPSPNHGADPDLLLEAFTEWSETRGLTLYPAQEEAILEIYSGSNIILATPTGTGKSLVALAAHFAALAQGMRTFYTAPIKALVSEKFFALCDELGSGNVGMMTGDAAVNAEAPVICCTAEVLANLALREGEGAEVAQVVMDEFHYYAEADRGWAWQIPLLCLPQAQFILMSATLGDTKRFEDDLSRRTGYPTRTITSATRPVPLTYEYRHTALHETIETLLETNLAPVYVVHFTQASAVERAQSLMSINMCTKEEKAAIAAAIGEFRFNPGFGKALSRFLRHGIGVHHAGMLPKYRRLVERLAQDGHLKVICGTDTLGVGINVPIRTVLFTQLAKYDGVSSRILTAREFHQIAGRAGRAGFDTIGYVWAQAPEHVIENEKAVEKAAGDAKKLRKIVKKKPPTRGYVPWSEDTFTKLIAKSPEPLTSSFTVSHSMLLNVLNRPGDGCGAMRHLLVDNHETRPKQRQHIRHAISIYRSLRQAKVVEELDEPDELGRKVRLTVELQENFALNQPLSPFVLAAVPHLEHESEHYSLDVLSLVEAVLEDPGVVLSAQLNKLRTETVSRLKAEGVEYEERMAQLDQLEYPKPLREFTYNLFDEYRTLHPWVRDHNIRPKSVARDMYERAMTFSDYIRHYELARSEGLVLRYLSDAYKGLVQNVPAEAKTDEVHDLEAWLGETVRQIDSSLLDEWEELLHPDSEEAPEVRPGDLQHAAQNQPAKLSDNARAFAIMIRNEAFRWVELLSRQDYEALAEREGSPHWRSEALTEAMAPYWAEYDTVEIGNEARGSTLFALTKTKEDWRVRQGLLDPEANREWYFEAEVDLEASNEEGRAVLRLLSIERHG